MSTIAIARKTESVCSREPGKVRTQDANMSETNTIPRKVTAKASSGLSSTTSDPCELSPVASHRRPEPTTGLAQLSKQPTLARIMIVDDEETNIRVVRKYLSDAGYSNFIVTTQPTEVMQLALTSAPDIILLDIIMPEIDGLQILHELRQDSHLQNVPVLILTAAAEADVKLEALDLGATDFLVKPVDKIELNLRMRNAVTAKIHSDQLSQHSELLEKHVRARTAELERTRKEVIHCLARAGEYRDGDTGHHVIRVGMYVRTIAERLGFIPRHAEIMEQAAKLHDVGKIGIPDAILLKPGKLTSEEFQIIENHCTFGKDIIQELPEDLMRQRAGRTDPKQHIRDILALGGSPLLTLAAVIAQTHHEKWDGSGYPLGLAGEDIPIEGRITAVADVFDALSSERPYKKAFPLEKCLRIIREESGTHFDPRIASAFLNDEASIVQIQRKYAD